MSDLISRQAVLDYPIRLDHYDEEHGNRHFVLGIESVMEYVEYLPSADAVEVVRCMNCIYGEERIEDYRCRKLDEDWDIRFSPTHFCSYGRRREP